MDKQTRFTPKFALAEILYRFSKSGEAYAERNVAGLLVRTLRLGYKGDKSDPGGICFYRIRAGGFTDTRKLAVAF